MATKPVMLPSAVGPAFWKELQSRLAERIRECNTIAAEQLWTVSTIAGPVERIVVASASNTNDRVEVSFNMSDGVIVCTPGPGVAAPPLRFQWRSESLSLDEAPCTLDAAVAVILDELVSTDQGMDA